MPPIDESAGSVNLIAAQHYVWSWPIYANVTHCVPFVLLQHSAIMVRNNSSTEGAGKWVSVTTNGRPW